MQLNSILNEIEKGNESSDLITGYTGYMDLFWSASRRSCRKNRTLQSVNHEKKNKNDSRCCCDCDCCCDCGFLY